MLESAFNNLDFSTALSIGSTISFSSAVLSLLVSLLIIAKIVFFTKAQAGSTEQFPKWFRINSKTMLIFILIQTSIFVLSFELNAYNHKVIVGHDVVTTIVEFDPSFKALNISDCVRKIANTKHCNQVIEYTKLLEARHLLIMDDYLTFSDIAKASHKLLKQGEI